MTIEKLANTETELYLIVLDLYKIEQTDELNKKIKTVFASYRQVHKHYSDLAKENDEALKRGLFIQWYDCVEPNCITGIDELDEESEENIIDLVEEKIQSNSLDAELKWMVNYYATWDFVFDKFKNRKGLGELNSHSTDGFPLGLVIDRKKMKQRGQMGTYWNSLTR